MRTATLFFVLLHSMLAFSQGEGSEPQSSGFGAAISGIYGHVNLELSSTAESLNMHVQSFGGYAIGLLYHKQLSKKIRIRPAMQTSFLHSHLVYEDATGDIVRQQIFPAYLEFPLHFVFANKEIGNNIEAIFGIKFAKSLSFRPNNALSLESSSTSAEFGLGKEFSFRGIRFSPEILISLGINDLYRHSSVEVYAENIEGIMLNQLSLRFTVY